MGENRVSISSDEAQLYSLDYVMQKASRNIRILTAARALVSDEDCVSLYAEAIGLLALAKRLAAGDADATSRANDAISLLTRMMFPLHARFKEEREARELKHREYVASLAKIDARIDAEFEEEERRSAGHTKEDDEDDE